MAPTEAAGQPAQIRDLALRGRRRLATFAIVRTSLTIALVVTIYFLLPLDHGSNAGAVAKPQWESSLVAIIVWQIRRIVGSDHPISRAVEALALSVPLYVLLFATTYFLMARANQASFAGTLSRTDAMYFSPPSLRPLASETSLQRARPPVWWSRGRCGWICCSWVWWSGSS